MFERHTTIKLGYIVKLDVEGSIDAMFITTCHIKQIDNSFHYP